MAGPADLASFKDGLIILGAAAIVVPLVQRLRVSSILGFWSASSSARSAWARCPKSRRSWPC